MGSYGDGEGLVYDLLVAMPGFSVRNVTRGNWLIRNTGNSDHYAILKPGRHTRKMIAPITRLDTFQTIIQVWQQYQEHGTSLITLESLVDSILNHIDQYRKIGDEGSSINDANIVEARETIEVRNSPQDVGPAWLYTELVLEWNEETEITFAE
jgi:hypothetical protein